MADDDEVESPDARAPPGRRRAPPFAVADAARTLKALQETDDWPSRALPRAAAPQPDAGPADASPPRAPAASQGDRRRALRDALVLP